MGVWGSRRGAKCGGLLTKNGEKTCHLFFIKMMFARKVGSGVSFGEHLMKLVGEGTEAELTLFGTALELDKRLVITKIPVGGLTRTLVDAVDDSKPVFLVVTEWRFERNVVVLNVVVGGFPDFVLDEPRGIGDEAIAERGVEGHGGFDQPFVACLNQVLERCFRAEILLGCLHSIAKIGTDETLACLFVAVLHKYPQFVLVVGSERLVRANLTEITVDTTNAAVGEH